MAATKPPAPLPWWASFACGGLAACIAEVVTLPIDTAKVRLQLLKKAAGATAAGGATAAAGTPLPAQNIGMIRMVGKIAAEEGPIALYKGFWPAIHRQLVFASLRIGLYGQISAMFRKPGETTVSLPRKILAGLAAGAIGISVANPTDLVKVRFQSEGRLAPGQKSRYSGVMNAYATIVKQEGLGGLWTGLGPSIARNSIINATELASYETAKEFFLGRMGLADNLGTHFLSGAVAGAMATLVGNPVDVVKTRVMAAQTGAAAAAAGGAAQYTGAVDCIVKTLRHEGPAAFYQGVVPQFFRITGWNIVMFISFEKLKAAAAAALGPTTAEPSLR